LKIINIAHNSDFCSQDFGRNCIKAACKPKLQYIIDYLQQFHKPSVADVKYKMYIIGGAKQQCSLEKALITKFINIKIPNVTLEQYIVYYNDSSLNSNEEIKDAKLLQKMHMCMSLRMMMF